MTNSSSDEAETIPDSLDVQIVDGVTVVTFLRPASVEETKAVAVQIRQYGTYHRRVWDLSRVDFPFSMEETRELAFFGRNNTTEANRVAIVVKDTVGFGSSRAFSAYREGDNLATARVFTSLVEAMQWVKAGD